jgi:hypothetical protein
MDQNEISNLYREPSIDASYQVSYHLAKRFQRKSCFRNRTIRNKNCLWRPCLLTDQNGMSNSHRGPSIDASYQVSVHLAKRFQRTRILEIDQLETRIACGSQWKVLHKDCSFHPDPLTNMAATGDACFWLADFLDSSPLKPFGQMNRNMVGSIYGMSSVTIAHFIPIR